LSLLSTRSKIEHGLGVCTLAHAGCVISCFFTCTENKTKTVTRVLLGQNKVLSVHHCVFHKSSLNKNTDLFSLCFALSLMNSMTFRQCNQCGPGKIDYFSEAYSNREYHMLLYKSGALSAVNVAPDLEEGCQVCENKV
jgi:hypothetical protein